jgi:hypothetical protein
MGALISARKDSAAVTVGASIILTGGNGQSVSTAWGDVYRSDDLGSTWTVVTKTAPWTGIIPANEVFVETAHHRSPYIWLIPY